MSQIDPFTSSIVQAPFVQHQQATEKDRQIRRAQDLEKDAALQEDELEHQVESAEELAPINEQQKQDRNFKRSKHEHTEQSEDEPGEEPHLDLTA
jgi:uncharacterized membrane protein YcgQ (UPF0703/DUF1980 family)